jgi:archaeal flagellar protein FlaJ
MRRVYISASKIFPKKTIDETGRMLNFAGLNVEPEVWLGQALIIALIVLLKVNILGFFGNQTLFFILSILAFIIYLMGAAQIPFFIAEKRAETVEEVLPSALQLMSSNIRAGMTPFQSMKIAARNEFGLLKDEIDKATNKALGTESFSQALREISNDIKLPALERSIKLVVRSIEGGGHLARTLEEASRDISDNIMLRRELLSSTRTYTVLILITVLLGAPLLFNISIYFTQRLDMMKGSFDTESIGRMGVGMIISDSFSQEFLVNISTVTIAFTAFIASLLIGVIVKGSEKYGLKYALFIVPLSLTIFYIIRNAIQSLLI